MDDKLYYVESPDEQVLGPMTMMHVLEGVAAGVILESARICEVGEQEWVYLSDVAYTREGDSDPDEAAASAEQYFGRQETRDEGPEAELEVMHGSAWQADSARAPEPEPSRDDPFVNAGAYGEGAGTSNDDGFAEAAGASRADSLAEAAGASRADSFAEAAGPMEADEPIEAGEPLLDPEFLAEEPYVEEVALSASRPDGFDAPFDENESGTHAPLRPAGEDGRRRPKWLVPALAALLVPAFVGAWLFTGRPLPFVASGESAPAPAPEVSPLQQARELLVSGQAAEAQLRYERILSEDPANPAALHGRGMAAMAAGDAQTAVESLEQACSSADARPAWTADLAQALNVAGRKDSALQRMGAYLADHPEDRDNQVARLDWLLESGRSAEAARLYTGLAKDNPVNAFSQYLAGLALAEDPAAETYLRRSIELDPAQGDAHAALGRLLAVKGDAAAAKESLRRASERRPASAEERALLASLDKATAPAPAPVPPPAPKAVAKPAPQPPVTASAARPAQSAPEPAPAPPPAPRPEFSTFAAKIRDALDGERFESARNILSEARKAAGNGRDARNNAGLWEGIIAFEEGRFDDALARFQALDPEASYSASGFGNGAAANWTARVWFAKGDVRKAVAALDGVGPADPDEYAMARLWEGLALATLGMDDLAARTWERIPGDVGARVRASGRGAVKSAELLTGVISEKDYRTAVAPLAGFGNDMYFFLAYAAQRKADRDTARENFTRAVEESAGREFPYHLARAQITGEGILGDD